MDRKADTHIRVTEETWAALNARKRPGDSFDDVIQRLLEQHEERESEDETPHPGSQQFDLNDTTGEIDADDEELVERLEEMKE